ncbi:hypothetical protein KVH27_35440 [Streptomyces olivaceus]|uniref:hypothetical protein n=1 Tax=Streptomyces olivaceus TaxID=47716 RepID=UPI001CCD8E93|nr:hypothetical protein [Streptomyces olivaceus]MBZ6253646.1 hypothetical protein [Streptomyces olivaceus]
MLRRADGGSERLERALDGGPIPHDAETRRLLAAAGALAPGFTRDPARVQATEDAMMLAFERAMNPLTKRENAGTDDGLEETELHREEVALPGGGRMVVSDLEHITPDRLDEATQMYADILARKSKDRQS